MLGTFKIIERIQDEIDEAEEYIELANMFKVSKPNKAKLFLEIAKDECKHAEKLINFKQQEIMSPNAAKATTELTASEKAREHAHAAWEQMQPLLSAEVANLKREINTLEIGIHNPY